MLRLLLYQRSAGSGILNLRVRNMSDTEKLTPRLRPSNFDKKLLVWTKNFKNAEEIPQFIQPELIERARSQARIKISNRLMVLTALGCVVAIFLGKSAAGKGESVHQQNLDWHKNYQENYEKKKESSANKSQ